MTRNTIKRIQAECYPLMPALLDTNTAKTVLELTAPEYNTHRHFNMSPFEALKIIKQQESSCEPLAKPKDGNKYMTIDLINTAYIDTMITWINTVLQLFDVKLSTKLIDYYILSIPTSEDIHNTLKIKDCIDNAETVHKPIQIDTETYVLDVTEYIERGGLQFRNEHSVHLCHLCDLYTSENIGLGNHPDNIRMLKNIIMQLSAVLSKTENEVKDALKEMCVYDGETVFEFENDTFMLEEKYLLPSAEYVRTIADNRMDKSYNKTLIGMDYNRLFLPHYMMFRRYSMLPLDIIDNAVIETTIKYLDKELG